MVYNFRRFPISLRIKPFGNVFDYITSQHSITVPLSVYIIKVHISLQPLSVWAKCFTYVNE